MSRFDTDQYIDYDKLQHNLNTVKQRWENVYYHYYTIGYQCFRLEPAAGQIDLFNPISDRFKSHSEKKILYFQSLS